MSRPRAEVAYAEGDRWIYKFQPPVQIDGGKLHELKVDSHKRIKEIQIGPGSDSSRDFLTVGRLEDIAALALTGPNSWGTPQFESRVAELGTSLCGIDDDPRDIAERLTALFEGEHIGHVVSYDEAASAKHVMGNQNCW